MAQTSTEGSQSCSMYIRLQLHEPGRHSKVTMLQSLAQNCMAQANMLISCKLCQKCVCKICCSAGDTMIGLHFTLHACSVLLVFWYDCVDPGDLHYCATTIMRTTRATCCYYAQPRPQIPATTSSCKTQLRPENRACALTSIISSAGRLPLLLCITDTDLNVRCCTLCCRRCF